ncbi:hypothetical protein [Dictyobacter kobayashii]|uniref:hypothetical protein n=1 Tax=Dictyobacter kobayashii TaxID=2014872 RepID=UPI001386E533|nr:hypothetical protein [Dictyobacter kobayashii]
MPRGTLSLGYGAAGAASEGKPRTYKAEPIPFVLRVAWSYGKGREGLSSDSNHHV